MRKTHICEFNSYFWNASSDHTKNSEFDKLSLSNNALKFGFEKIIQSKVIVKSHSALKVMPIAVPVETIIDNFDRLSRLAYL